eukprot:jgi/Ulvmu1/6526/UM003_0159.1
MLGCVMCIAELRCGVICGSAWVAFAAHAASCTCGVSTVCAVRAGCMGGFAAGPIMSRLSCGAGAVTCAVLRALPATIWCKQSACDWALVQAEGRRTLLWGSSGMADVWAVVYHAACCGSHQRHAACTSHCGMKGYVLGKAEQGEVRCDGLHRVMQKSLPQWCGLQSGLLSVIASPGIACWRSVAWQLQTHHSCRWERLRCKHWPDVRTCLPFAAVAKWWGKVAKWLSAVAASGPWCFMTDLCMSPVYCMTITREIWGRAAKITKQCPCLAGGWPCACASRRADIWRHRSEASSAAYLPDASGYSGSSH